MLFYGAGLLSAFVTAVWYVFFGTGRLLLIPGVFLASFIVFLLLSVLLCWISTLFVNFEEPCEKHSPLYRFWTNCVIESATQLLRIRLHVSGTECLPEEKFLLVSNHRGAMDPLLQMGVLRKWHTGFVAKQELFHIPIIGKLMHKSFCLSLNRGKLKDEAKTVLRAIKLLKEQRAAIGIYPEGTRNTTGELLPFKNGAFKIALKAECPIVVAVIRNTELATKRAPWRSTDVYLDFVGCIGTCEIREKNTIEIGQIVRQMMEQKLQPEVM